MTEEVGVDVLLDAGLGGALFDDLADAVGAERATPDRKKDFGAGFFLWVDEVAAFVVEVVLDRFSGSATDGDEAGFVSFSGDADEAVVEIEVFEFGRANLGEAQAGGVEEFEEGEVAATKFFRRVDGIEEGDEMLGVECFGKVGAGFGGEERFGWVGLQLVARDEEAEEDFEVDGVDAE